MGKFFPSRYGKFDAFLDALEAQRLGRPAAGPARRAGTGRRNGDLEVGFWDEKIENFEKLRDRPESIWDVFGKCLGVFGCNLEPLAVVLERVATLFVPPGGILVPLERL